LIAYKGVQSVMMMAFSDFWIFGFWILDFFFYFLSPTYLFLLSPHSSLFIFIFIFIFYYFLFLFFNFLPFVFPPPPPLALLTQPMKYGNRIEGTDGGRCMISPAAKTNANKLEMELP